MSIAALIKAAEFIERRDREAEHGYASTLPVPDDLRTIIKRSKTKKSLGSRTTHNELEKNRRAHLRDCLETLKDIVPLGPEASKHTTLGLLTKAKKYIKNLEEREKRHGAYRETLARKQRYLRRRLARLERAHPLVLALPVPSPLALPAMARERGAHRFRAQTSLALQRRSLSECSEASSACSASSAGSVSSGLSASSGSASRCAEPNSISESDEVDVIGYTSNQSDTDQSDRSSVQSGSGDSGVALSASATTLSLSHIKIV